MTASALTSRHDSLLFDHAAGNLSAAASFVVDAHLALSPAARQAGAILETAGAVLLEELPPVSLKVPAWLSDGGPAPAALAVADPMENLLASLDHGAWRWTLPGMLIKPVGNTGARLLKIEAGRKVPEHGHRGLELTLVLAGELEDATGRYGRGDLCVHDEETEHMPGAVAGAGNCICLIAESAPVRLKGPLGWVVNPFLS